ncbi:hypothetical protein A4G18_08960 [Pasteurellaceae bacterium Pebbles2]|nr:hypothetical protein [Pasteurellaceae bacterium Pebbles2]
MITNLVLLHIVGAFLSLALLASRGAMQLSGKDWRAVKLLKILPHLSDTILLTTAVVLAYYFGFSLWLGAKIACFVLYVIFSAKFFSKKAVKPNALFLLIAVFALIAAITLGYSH